MTAEKLIERLREKAKSLPLGHESKERGASSYNWYMHIIRVAEDILEEGPR